MIDHHGEALESETESRALTMSEAVRIADRMAGYAQLGLDGEWPDGEIETWASVLDYLQAKTGDINSFLQMAS